MYTPILLRKTQMLTNANENMQIYACDKCSKNVIYPSRFCMHKNIENNIYYLVLYLKKIYKKLMGKYFPIFIFGQK